MKTKKYFDFIIPAKDADLILEEFYQVRYIDEEPEEYDTCAVTIDEAGIFRRHFEVDSNCDGTWNLDGEFKFKVSETELPSVKGFFDKNDIQYKVTEIRR